MVELSADQCVTLQYMANGLTNRQIGERLYLTEETVRSRVARILKVTKTKNRTHAVANALREGWIV